MMSSTQSRPAAGGVNDEDGEEDRDVEELLAGGREGAEASTSGVPGGSTSSSGVSGPTADLFGEWQTGPWQRPVAVSRVPQRPRHNTYWYYFEKNKP